MHGAIILYAENFIDGSEFLGLTLSEIREMVLPIGIAKKCIPKVL